MESGLTGDSVPGRHFIEPQCLDAKAGVDLCCGHVFVLVRK
jgi:hypothetical protein